MSAVKLLERNPLLLMLKPVSRRSKESNYDLIVVCPVPDHPGRYLVEAYPYDYSKNPFKAYEWNPEHLSRILDRRHFIAFQAKALAANLRLRLLNSGFSCRFQSFCLTRLLERISRDFIPDYEDPLASYESLMELVSSLNVEELEIGLKPLLKLSYLPPNLNLNDLEQLPDDCGVYFFYGKCNQLLYVGKSIQIRQRVISHFQEDGKDRKETRMVREIHRVGFQSTAGELGALLLESDCIKRLSPKYNVRLRKTDKYLALCLEEDEHGYHRCRVISGVKAVERVLTNRAAGLTLVALFGSKGALNGHLASITQDFNLCKKLVGLESGKGPCFGYQLRKCQGACCQDESNGAYNARLALALENIRFEAWPYRGRIALREKNTLTGKLEYHVIDHWRYIGSTQSRKDALKLRKPTNDDHTVDLDCYKILRKYLGAQVRSEKRSSGQFSYRTLEIER